jgi:hypothetical protein
LEHVENQTTFPMRHRHVVEEFRRMLREAFADSFKGMILYGSCARGDLNEWNINRSPPQMLAVRRGHAIAGQTGAGHHVFRNIFVNLFGPTPGYAPHSCSH